MFFPLCAQKGDGLGDEARLQEIVSIINEEIGRRSRSRQPGGEAREVRLRGCRGAGGRPSSLPGNGGLWPGWLARATQQLASWEEALLFCLVCSGGRRDHTPEAVPP